MSLCGGYSDPRVIDDRVKNWISHFEPQILEQASNSGLKNPKGPVKADSYSTQVVAGLNYKVLCTVGTDEGDRKIEVVLYAHWSIGAEGTPELTSVSVA